MGLGRCLLIHREALKDFDTSIIREMTQEYIARGISPLDAARRAVDDKLAELKAERRRIEKDVLAQYKELQPELFEVEETVGQVSSIPDHNGRDAARQLDTATRDEMVAGKNVGFAVKSAEIRETPEEMIDGRHQAPVSGLSVAEVTRALSPLRKLFPRLDGVITVVQSVEDIKGIAVAANARGIYLGKSKRIYLVADHIGSIGEATKTAYREGIGHLAIEELLETVEPGLYAKLLRQVSLLDRGGNKLVRQIADEVRATNSRPLRTPTLEEVRRVARENGLTVLQKETVAPLLRRLAKRPALNAEAKEMLRLAQPVTLTDHQVAAEVLAVLAERRVRHGEQFSGSVKSIVDRFLRALRSFGRLVSGQPMTERDLLRMLQLAERYLADPSAVAEAAGKVLRASTLGKVPMSDADPYNLTLDLALPASQEGSSRVVTATKNVRSWFVNVSKRLMYMGRTPSKYSKVGNAVVDRMREQGLIRGKGPLLRDNPNKLKLKVANGWMLIDETVDMAHLTDAVIWWNTKGRETGAKSALVREFMQNSENYILQPRSINRSEGAKMDERYEAPIPPTTPVRGEP